MAVGAAAAIAGAALTADRTPRVDTAALGEIVWETLDPSPAAPPQCRRLTGTDIGRWRCEIRYSGGAQPNFAPRPSQGPPPPQATPRARVEIATVVVAGDGGVVGETKSGKRLTGCCVLLK